MIIRFILICAVFISFTSMGLCQASENVIDTGTVQILKTVRSITIVGNKHTKSYIIEREIVFEKEQTYLSKNLQKLISLSKEQLMNTALFVDVDISTNETGSEFVDIIVNIKERWYFFPLPYFKVIDRNWNEWIHTNGASLNRVDYGLKVMGNNFSGRNDKLNFWLISGYTRQVSFNYYQPYIDKKLQQGLYGGFQYARNREINYATDYDTLRFLKLSGFVRDYFNVYGGYTYRKGSKERHNIRVSYNDIRVDSSVGTLNRNYFGNGSLQEKFMDISYAFQYFNVDYIPYPLRGWYVDVYAFKRFNRNLNQWGFGGKYLQSWPLFANSYFTIQAAGVIKFPSTQPYFNRHLMGYGDISMRGLEYYVIDGTIGGFIGGTIRKKLFKVTFNNFFKSKTYNKIPFTLYGKIFNDIGYVYDKNPVNSRLSNTFLRSGGIGLDIVTIYDIVLKLEFSFNQLNKTGFYFHTASDF